MKRLTDRATPRRTTSPAVDALCGLLAAGAALGSAQLVALVLRPEASPLFAVSGGIVDLTPLPVKEWAVATFGTADKGVLLVGIVVVLAVAAALLAVRARRDRWVAAGGVVAVGAIGVVAALTRPTAHLTDAIPAIAGAAVAYGVLLMLFHYSEPSEHPEPRYAQVPDRTADPMPDPGAKSSTEVNPVPRATPGPPRTAFDRRRFVLAATATALASAGAGYAGTRRADAELDTAASRAAITLPEPTSPAPPLPARADLGIEGLAPYVTPNDEFCRIDTAFSVPQLDATTWRLRLHGLGIEEREYTFDELLNRADLVERYVTLACVSNPVGGDYVGNAAWIGIPLANLLREAGVRPPSAGGPADQLISRSSDGMTIGTPVEDVMDGRDAMLALGMNGEPLPPDHGFPVRMVVPGLYGYVSACKWLVELELSTFDSFDAYWVPRGWSQQAPIKTQSRIDTPRHGANRSAGEVVIAGVAWAQTRGIEAVEVRIDDGPWQAAELAATTSVDTWRQWALRWDAEPGEHTIEVRATDGTGTVQDPRASQPAPDGATGYHSVRVTITG